MKALQIFFLLAFCCVARFLNAEATDTGNLVKHSLPRELAKCSDRLDELGMQSNGFTLNLNPLPYLRRVDGKDFNLEDPQLLEYPQAKLNLRIRAGQKLVSSRDRSGRFFVRAREKKPDILDPYGKYLYTWNYEVPALHFNFSRTAENPRSEIDILFQPLSHGVPFRYFPKVEGLSFSKERNLLAVSVKDSGTDTDPTNLSTIHIYDLAEVRAGKTEALQKIGGHLIEWLKISADGDYIFCGSNFYGHYIYLFRRNQSTGRFEELDLRAYNSTLREYGVSQSLHLNFHNATIVFENRSPILNVLLSFREGVEEYRFYRMPIDVQHLQVLKN